jgi:hypothetical protein
MRTEGGANTEALLKSSKQLFVVTFYTATV